MFETSLSRLSPQKGFYIFRSRIFVELPYPLQEMVPVDLKMFDNDLSTKTVTVRCKVYCLGECGIHLGFQPHLKSSEEIR